ncbi:MAG: fused MFS/spermidine synthase [Thermoanaerobaculia bacterium]
MEASQESRAATAAGVFDPRLMTLYGLFFLSGVAALIYEVMWMRSFSLVFGSTTEAASAVLGAFFGGLALGSLWGAKLASRRAAALWRYGVAEIAIAAGALLVDVWILWFRDLYPSIYQLALGSDWVLTACKLSLAFVAMGLPCVAMGTTLPLITRSIVAGSEHLGRRVGTAYALNTIGAMTGVLLAGFVLPPSIGTRNSIYVAVAINVAVGLAAILVARSRRAESLDGDAAGAEAQAPATIGKSDPAVLLVVVASGFGTVALEVLYTRLIVNVTDSSVFSFALMLATFLVFLGLASLLVSRTVDRLENPWKLLAWTQSLAVVAILISPGFFQLAADSAPGSLLEYLLRLLRQLILVVGPTILLVGVALPTAWKLATRNAAESGLRVGRLTGLNTFGAVAGSVITGFIVIPKLGILLGILSTALLYCGVAVLSWYRGYGRARAIGAGAVLAVTFAALFVLGGVRVFFLEVAPEQRVVKQVIGESVNVAVIDDPRVGRIMKVNNNYVLGRSDKLAVDMQRGQGGLPLLLHPEPKSAAFIGVATGGSVSAVLDFPVERVLAIELLSEVVEAAAYFEAVNRGVLKSDKVEILVADGRNHLFATEERFDAVVGDLFAPWQAGTGYLYTGEHFRGVASRLEDGGVFVQWLPAHQLAVAELRMIVATFLDVFPSAELWLNRPDVRALGSLALVAWAGGEPTPGERVDVAQSSARFVGLEYLCGADVLARWSSGAPRNSDEWPRVEFSAAVSRFKKGGHVEEMRSLITELRLWVVH